MEMKRECGSERGAQEAGFTLIEALVVLGIIAALSVLLMVGLGGVSQQKLSVAQMQDIKDLKNAMISYTLHTGCNIQSENMAELWDKTAPALQAVQTCQEKWKGPYRKYPTGYVFGSADGQGFSRGPLGEYHYQKTLPTIGGSKWNAVFIRNVAGDVAAAVDKGVDNVEDQQSGMIYAGECPDLSPSAAPVPWPKGQGGAQIGGGAVSNASTVCILIEPVWE